MAGAPTSKGFANQRSAATAGRFLVLDGMRGIAAFAVILDHVDSATLRAWLPGRYLAVDFFFVLSGFVLAHAYGKRLEDRTLSAFEFMRARFIRLYPLYLLGLAFGLVLPLAAAFKGWGNAAPFPEMAVMAAFGLLFLPAPPAYGWTGGHLYPFNGASWSLFFELVANLVYAVVAPFLTWRVFAVGLPICAAAVAFTVTGHETLGPGWLWPHFDGGLARVIYCFFAGVAVYKMRERTRLPALPAWASALALLAILAVPAIGSGRQGYDAFAAIFLMPLLVALAAGSKVGGRAAALCGTLGLLSYGVYVLHGPLAAIANLAMQAAGVSLPYGFLEVLMVAAVAALAAAIATRFYDAPLRRLLTRRAKPAKAPLATGETG